jgi:hypothetical protein
MACASGVNMEGVPEGLWRILQLMSVRRIALLDDPSASSWATATPPPIAVNVAVKTATLQARRIMSSELARRAPGIDRPLG